CSQNAFATVRACWLDWRAIKKDPSNPFQVWTDGFLAQRLISLMEQDGPGSPPSWSPWNIPFPKLPGEPGDGPLVPGSGAGPIGDDDALILALADRLEAAAPADAPWRAPLIAAMDALKGVFLTDTPNTSAAQAALQAAAGAISASQAAADILEELGLGSALSPLAILAQIGVAIAYGYLRDLFLKGPSAWDALDQQDFRAWLASCRASPTVLASGPINAFYDLAFAAVKGRENGLASGSMAAGASLRAQLEMALGYRDAPLFKMAAGMGDTVFTPFYDVLSARGVAINFFSRVVGLSPAGDGALGTVSILPQAATLGGAAYQPFTRVLDLDCWPDQPDWSQLENGAALEAAGVDFESSYCTVSAGPARTLTAGVDFDLAIMAMPPQSIGRYCGDLIEGSPAWASAIQAATSVGTQSLQLWMKPSVEALGWTAGPTVLTSYAEPYDSWGDMSHLVDRETWSDPPGSIAYFCGCLPTLMGLPVGPPEMHQIAQSAADSWLGASLSTLWPDVGPNPVSGSQVLSRYDVANFDVSDTYVQTPAGGNVASRFDPAQTAGFSNLYTVGDWTKTRFSGGCFESAIESAMLACRAISGIPQSIKTA
ncbi:MAG: FAD-dependent oxidoreductase, partial [Caulobacteraceae bacterium]